MMEKAKTYFKNFIKIAVMNLTRILFIFPVKKGRVFFSSYLGRKVTCNPKCIYDYLKETLNGGQEYIWAYNGTREEASLEENVKIVKEFSLKWFYYRATSQIVVDNCNPTFVVPRRDKQLIVQTWHAGGAYKKVGCAASTNNFEKWMMNKTISVANLFVSSSEVFTRENIEKGYHYKGEIINSGMPRNDIFFNLKKIQEATEKVKRSYGVNGVLVLYAPTYRGNLHHSTKMGNLINIDQLQRALELRYKKEINIMLRCHYWDNHDYDYKNNIVDATKYPDMQELLCAADILITDYSSCMWDYALLGRPCFLYVPDFDEYNENRGFFTKAEEWPGIICKDMDELCKRVEDFDEIECSVKAENYLQTMRSYETGNATRKVSNKIINYMNE